MYPRPRRCVSKHASRTSRTVSPKTCIGGQGTCCWMKGVKATVAGDGLLVGRGKGLAVGAEGDAGHGPVVPGEGLPQSSGLRVAEQDFLAVPHGQHLPVGAERHVVDV